MSPKTPSIPQGIDPNTTFETPSKEQSIPIVAQVRMQSQRCPGKCVRPFHNGQSLTELFAANFKEVEHSYIAGHETVFQEVAEAYDIGFVQRNSESAQGEGTHSVMNYIWDIPGDYICVVNVCTPLLKAQTVLDAIEHFRHTPCQTLLPVVASHDTLLDADQKRCTGLQTSFNSQSTEAIYHCSSCFVIFLKQKLWDLGTYFTRYAEGEPMFYPISSQESIDIDTEEDFTIAQAAYASAQVIYR